MSVSPIDLEDVAFGLPEYRSKEKKQEVVVVLPLKVKAIVSSRAAEHLKKRLIGVREVLSRALLETELDGVPVIDLYGNKLALLELKDGVLYFVKWVDIEE